MKKVLLINDSKFEVIIMKDVLNTLGFETIVGDEFDALKLAQNLRPDLVIANYIMKEIRGDQLIALIKTMNPGIKCVLSSSNAISASDFQHKKIDAVFQTPIENKALMKILDDLTAEAAVEVKRAEDLKPPAPQVKPLEKPKPEPAAEVQKFCPFCGHTLDTKSGGRYAFCPYCGHKL